MTVFDDITTPQEMNLLVAFFDLARFFPYSKQHPAQELFDLMSAYFEFTGDIIEESEGKIIKFLGDEGLTVHPEDMIDRGVVALKTLQEAGDAWLAERNIPCRNVIKVHFGPVVCGPVGTRTDKRLDIYGHTVSTAAKLKSNGFAITPQVFRKLNADTRKLFKKHTPPITYIPVAENHQD